MFWSPLDDTRLHELQFKKNLSPSNNKTVIMSPNNKTVSGYCCQIIPNNKIVATSSGK